MTTVGQRIRDERERYNISRVKLAKAAGIAVSTLSDLELGLSKSTTKLHHIAASLGVRPEWLETGRGPKEAAQEDPDWDDIEASTQNAALGDGADLDEYADTHRLKFRRDSLARKRLSSDKLLVFYGNGDSMEPRIRNGDALLVNTAETDPIHDAIFMVRWEGRYYAKRLKRLGRQWFLCSDNLYDPKWRDPIAIEDHHDFEIIGRVRWVGSWEE
jgi:phage repressor protein C with HTH and peptisase S24 domain